jgi:Uma2 family endonuclease
MATTARTKPRRRLMTTEEYLALPTDDERTELVYGEVVMCASPAYEHNFLIYCLVDVLMRWTRHSKLGLVAFDIDMVLDRRKALIYAPDVLFLAQANQARLQRGRIYGPADLAVEVLSPSDRPIIQNRKFADYERYGVPWYWIIRPDSKSPTIEEHELVAGKYVGRSEVSGNEWFKPGLFPGLVFCLPPMIAGEELKNAVMGKAKKLV